MKTNVFDVIINKQSCQWAHCVRRYYCTCAHKQTNKNMMQWKATSSQTFQERPRGGKRGYYQLCWLWLILFPSEPLPHPPTHTTQRVPGQIRFQSSALTWGKGLGPGWSGEMVPWARGAEKIKDTVIALQVLSSVKAKKSRLSKIARANSRLETGERSKKGKSQEKQIGKGTATFGQESSQLFQV